MSIQLARFLESIESPRIAVVGDSILDEYIWGEVERVSPEAPIPVLRASHRELRAGGAGSVVVNLAELGVDVSFFSVCGDDPGGAKLKTLFARDSVSLDGLIEEPHRPTTVKCRHIGFVQSANRAMQQLLRVDDEVRTPIAPATIERMVEAFRAQAGALDAVLVSDYDKGLLSAELIERLREAAPPDLPFLVDPSARREYSLYRRTKLICPNRFEAQSATGIACRDFAGCERAAERLAEDLEIDVVALTMDADGILVYERGKRHQHFPTRQRVVTDVTGAGDMVLSILGLVMAAGGGITEAIQLANVAAGIEIRRLGVTPLTRREIAQEILHEGRAGAAKIQPLEAVAAAISTAREQGRRIVFTNGCFDFFHAGHHHLLASAAREGDVLVVAVNSDASVRRLAKGPGRPAIPEADRILMLASLEFVDHVVLFDEETPIRLLEALRPDVLVKGEEYRERGVIGGEFVEGYGGTVSFVPHLHGFSTTVLLEGRAGASPPTQGS